MEPLHQGDILKIEKIKHPVLVLNDKSGIIIISIETVSSFV